MLSNGPLATLSKAERQFLRHRWLRNGQCARSFHAAIRIRAEEAGSGSRNSGPEQGNDSGSPYNKPNLGPSRHQHAAMVSDEVRLLNRDTPSLGPSQPSNDRADFAVDAQSTGRGSPSSTMGENMPPEREGPLAQGLGRPVRSIDDEADGSIQIRGTRTPNGAVEEPTQGGASVMEPEPHVAGAETEKAQGRAGGNKVDAGKHVGQSSDIVTRAPSTMDPTTDSIVPAGPRIPPPSTPYQPTATSADQLLHSGSNTSTIASGNFQGVINDRIRVAADPAQPPGQRSVSELAHRLRRKKLVRYSSKDEKKAVENHLRRYERGSEALNKREQENADKKLDTDPYFARLQKNTRARLIETLVTGVYDSEGVLSGASKYKQPVLNEIAKMTMKNGTYLSSDGGRLLRKVQSMLPAMQTAPQRGGATGQQKRTANQPPR